MLDRIGLYEKLEPRGIVAPRFRIGAPRPPADRGIRSSPSQDDTAFPLRAAMRAHQIVEEALKLAKAHPNIDLRLAKEFHIVHPRTPTASPRKVTNPAGEDRDDPRRLPVSGEGARSIIRRTSASIFEGFHLSDRTLNIEVAYDFRNHAMRGATTSPIPTNGACFIGRPAGSRRIIFPTAPDEDETALTRPKYCRRAATLPADRQAVRYRSAAASLRVHQRVAQKFRVGRADPRRRFRAREQPDRAMGMTAAFTMPSTGGEADQDIAKGGRRCRARPLRAPAPTRRAQHTQAQTMRNKRLLARRICQCGRKTTTARRTADDPKLARAFLLRSSLIESLRGLAKSISQPSRRRCARPPPIFSARLSMKARNPCRTQSLAPNPSSWICAIMSGALSAAATASLKELGEHRSGSWRERRRPYQETNRNRGDPARQSSAGQATPIARGAGRSSARTLPVVTCEQPPASDRRTSAHGHRSDRSSPACAAIGHVHDVDLGHALEHLA